MQDWERISQALHFTRPSREPATRISQWRIDCLAVVKAIAAKHPKFHACHFLVLAGWDRDSAIENCQQLTRMRHR